MLLSDNDCMGIRIYDQQHKDNHEIRQYKPNLVNKKWLV